MEKDEKFKQSLRVLISTLEATGNPISKPETEALIDAAVNAFVRGVELVHAVWERAP